jgi:hypothetical protein
LILRNGAFVYILCIHSLLITPIVSGTIKHTSISICVKAAVFIFSLPQKFLRLGSLL